MTGINDLQTMFGSVQGSTASTGTSGVENKPTARVAARPAQNSSPVNDDQTVTLSTAAGTLAQVSGSDDVRHDKVEQLKAAIASGTYSVSSSQVADKLMENMLGGR